MASRKSSLKEKLSSYWSRVRNLSGLARFVLSVILIVFVINSFGIQSYEVFGQSMHPTLSHGDRLIISKVGKTTARILHNDYVPARGDIIVFTDPFLPSRQLIKRVVGLPGEQVKLANGTFTIYNQEHPNGFNPDSDSSVSYPFTSGDIDTEVPDDHLFVVGDNRSPGGSLDSRNELATVPLENVIGTLVLRVFPLTDLHLF